MSNINNDEKIIKLKEQIETKRKQLDKVTRFTPITNCSIEVDAVRQNLQVLTKEQLTMLMIRLNSYKMSAEQLEVLDECNISGYNVSDWITDIKSKLEIVSYKAEENKLKVMETKLHELLSNEKKTELAIDEIEGMLK